MGRNTLLVGVAAIIVIGVGGYVALSGGNGTEPAPVASDAAAQPAETTSTEQASGGGEGWDAGITDFDAVLGDPSAPVTMIEYASFTCPHCAAFHTETLPELKERFVDTGQLKIVFRDFPLDGVALQAGLLARCVPDDQYFNVVDVLFDTQRQWATAEDPREALSRIGQMAGLEQSTIDACLDDREMADRLVALREAGATQYDISSTPSFVIEGETHAGALPLEDFVALIEEAAAD